MTLLDEFKIFVASMPLVTKTITIDGHSTTITDYWLDNWCYGQNPPFHDFNKEIISPGKLPKYPDVVTGRMKGKA